MNYVNKKKILTEMYISATSPEQDRLGEADGP